MCPTNKEVNMDVTPVILIVLHTLYEAQVITSKQFIEAISIMQGKSKSIVPFSEQHRRLVERAVKETETTKETENEK
jgi:hypothetical protein